MVGAFVGCLAPQGGIPNGQGLPKDPGKRPTRERSEWSGPGLAGGLPLASVPPIPAGAMATAGHRAHTLLSSA